MSHPSVLARLTLAALGVAAVAAPAHGHVAASVDVNNRYLKLSPMPDRIRLAYTILVGDEPGSVVRRALDRDGDRVVSEAEAARWADALATQVRDALTVTIDGAPVPVTWSEVVAGFDDRSVDAGAFSLDLIAWLCAPAVAGRHELEVVDRLALEPAGETEIRVTDEPGVTPTGDRLVRFERKPAPLGDGLRVVYTVDRVATLDDRCGRAPKRPGASWRWPLLILGGVIASGLVLLLVVRAVRS
jgi:hypothetical protein